MSKRIEQEKEGKKIPTAYDVANQRAEELQGKTENGGEDKGTRIPSAFDIANQKAEELQEKTENGGEDKGTKIPTAFEAANRRATEQEQNTTEEARRTNEQETQEKTEGTAGAENSQQDKTEPQEEDRDSLEAKKARVKQKQEIGEQKRKRREAERDRGREAIKGRADNLENLEELTDTSGQDFEAKYDQKERELKEGDRENGKLALEKEGDLRREYEKLQEQIYAYRDSETRAQHPLTVKEIQNLQSRKDTIEQELNRINEFFGEQNLNKMREEIDRSQHPMKEEDVSREREDSIYISLGKQIRERYAHLRDELGRLQMEREEMIGSSKNIRERKKALGSNKEEQERLMQDLENVERILQPTEEVLQEEEPSTERETPEVETEEEEEEGDLESQMEEELDDDLETEGGEQGEQEQTPEEQERGAEQSDLEKDKKDRKKKIWDMITRVAGGLLGAKGGYALAGAALATGSIPLVAGMFVAGGALFLKRKQIGKGAGRFLGNFAGDIAVSLRRMTRDYQSVSEIEKEAEIRKRTMEIFEAFFTGAAAGTGVGIVLGGASGLIEGVYAPDVEPTEPTVEPEPRPTDPVETGQAAPTGEEFESVFGELGESFDLTEHFNAEEIQNAINEGNLLGENLLLEHGSIAEAQNSFMEILNNTPELSNIDFSTPENTRTFLEGIYEINREVLTNGSITEKAVEGIADNTVQALTQ